MDDEQKYVPLIEGTIKQWHNVSTQQPHIQIPGVTSEDLIVILENLKKYFSYTRLLKMEDELLKHINNYDNPHHVTPEQLPYSVIEGLYKTWLLEGYKGTLDEFKDAIYRYIEFATLEDQIEGTSEYLVPPVKVVYDYIKLHNESDSHSNLINEMFFGNAVEKDPFYALHHVVDHPCDISKYNEIEIDSVKYISIPFSDNYSNPLVALPITLLIRGKYLVNNRIFIGFSNEDLSSYISIAVNKIKFKLLGGDEISINISSLLTTASRIPFSAAMEIHCDKIIIYTLNWDSENKEVISVETYTFPEISNLTNLVIPKNNVVFSRSRLNDIIMYRNILPKEELISLIA